MEALNYKLSHKPNGISIFVIFWLTLSRFPGNPVHEMSQALQGVVQMMRQTSDDEREEWQYLIEYSPHEVIRLVIPRNMFPRQQNFIEYRCITSLSEPIGGWQDHP